MTTPRVNIIVAVAPDMAIGRSGDLLFHVAEDLRRFKSLTMGYPIVMGRKTFESLPKGALPGRRNIVVSHNADYHTEGVETVTSFADAIELCRDSEEVFIIGGAQIYSQALPMADRLLLTRFDRTADDADCYFPQISADEWKVTETTDFQTDSRSGVGYKFENLERR